jgi:hypothetical protein
MCLLSIAWSEISEEDYSSVKGAAGVSQVLLIFVVMITWIEVSHNYLLLTERLGI